MAINPVIDDKKFDGSNKGLAAPLRRTSAGAFALRIYNLDHADPPPPYQAGGVPRTPTFNGNALVISAAPKMPKIVVACDAIGFDPGVAKIVWRLQTLYVVGRYEKVSGGEKPHYRSRILSVGDTWTGESSAANFMLFDDDANVAYDNRTDRVAGGHAILTVAAKPADSNVWLQDYVHLRITGTNPTESIVRKYVQQALSQRNKNIEFMADAVFTHENEFEQFDPKARTQESYKGVLFEWPHDPANFPSVAFDFGIGIGQYTHPGQETVGICWDWRDNLDAGINELLDDLKATFAADKTFIKWAKNAWSKYNGSSAYGEKLAALPDGKKIETVAPPANFNRDKETAHVLQRAAAPPARQWPVTEKPPPVPGPIPHFNEAAQALVGGVGDKIGDPHMLAWIWPKIEHEVVNHSDHDNALTFPGLHESGLGERLAHLDLSARRQMTDAAFAHLWARAHAKPVRVPRGGGRPAPQRAARKSARGASAALPMLEGLAPAPGLLAAAPGNLSAEFNSLIPIVRQGVDHGISGWSQVRERLFEKFGKEGNPDAAILRINAYYGKLVPADFPPPPSSTKNRDTPVHPVLKDRLNRAAALLQDKNLTAALKFGVLGGFSIRNNANNAAVLSNHSFGWAVDLDPTLNPNIGKKNLPLDVIEGLTGLALYGPTSEALRTPRPFDACLPDVKLFTDASAALVAAFRTLTNLKAAAGRAITRTTGRTLSDSQVEAVFAAAAQSQAAMRQKLADAGLSTQQANTASNWLLAAIRLFPVKQKVKAPQVTGNAGTVAAFGFCNLPSELIAALIAADGGKLNWLGAARSTKDFMHFDLFPADQPKLVS